MTTPEIRANNVPGVIASDNVHIIQPTYLSAAGNHGQPVGMTTYPASSKVVQCDVGRVNLQNPVMLPQNPAGVTGAQGHLMVHQYPAGTMDLQTSPVVVQNSPRMMDPQSLPQSPQNPPNFIPGPMGTSNQFQWNMSFGSFSTFDPRKFVNDEVRTLGAIQILIGLTHIFAGINAVMYEKKYANGSSGYLFWGGLSYVISGSLSVHASKDSSPCVVNGSIGMNVFSAICSLVGICVLVSDMIVASESSIKVFAGSIFPFALLEFCLTCVTSHFGCQANCWKHFENMMAPAVFTANPINTTNNRYSATSSPYNAASGPVNATTSPVNITVNPVSPTTGTVDTITGPVSTTTNTVQTTTDPVSATTSPANIATSPAISSYSYSAPPGVPSVPSYQERADSAQK